MADQKITAFTLEGLSAVEAEAMQRLSELMPRERELVERSIEFVALGLGCVPERRMFAAQFTQVNKHLILAFASTMRLHGLQSAFSLRQVTEAGVLAFYFMAHPDAFKDDPAYPHIPRASVWGEACDFVENEMREVSDAIRAVKRHINKHLAHASPDQTAMNFRFEEEGLKAQVLDIPNRDAVRFQLWQILYATGTLARGFWELHKRYGGLEATADLEPIIAAMADEIEAWRRQEIAVPEGV